MSSLTVIDCSYYRCLRDNLDHILTLLDGLARTVIKQCLHWQLSFRGRHRNVVSAQWELILGNTYAYTVLSAFGFFYGGFGAIVTSLLGVRAAYGDDIASFLPCFRILGSE